MLGPRPSQVYSCEMDPSSTIFPTSQKILFQLVGTASVKKDTYNFETHILPKEVAGFSFDQSIDALTAVSGSPFSVGS
jgi:hypothetical protein